MGWQGLLPERYYWIARLELHDKQCGGVLSCRVQRSDLRRIMGWQGLCFWSFVGSTRISFIHHFATHHSDTGGSAGGDVRLKTEATRKKIIMRVIFSISARLFFVPQKSRACYPKPKRAHNLKALIGFFFKSARFEI
jgi:hypothetical protein